MRNEPMSWEECEREHIRSIQELKIIRNKINYEGLFIEKEYIERNKLEFEPVIQFLKKEIEEKLKS